MCWAAEHFNSTVALTMATTQRNCPRCILMTNPFAVLLLLVITIDADIIPPPLLPTRTPCGPCVCSDHDVKVHTLPAGSLGLAVDCSSRSLTSIPHGDLPTSATRLIFRNNSITVLQDFEFKDFFRLTHLDMSCNHISKISTKAFSDLFSLIWLSLEHNHLRSFGGHRLFAGTSALLQLDLSHNKLTNLSEDLGLGRSLKWLDLSHNCFITARVNGMTSSLVNLTYLDLSSNRLEGIDHLFVKTYSLQTLNLSHNHIPLNSTSYPRHVFEGCRSSLQELRLESNWKPGVFGEYARLSYPDQAFAELESLKYLHMDGLPETVFGSGFSKMTSLANLSLSGRDGYCSINSVRNNTFLHIPHSLRALVLSACNISVIEADAFRQLQYVHFLDLSNNMDLGFETIGNAFYSLQGSALQVLYINRVIRPYTMCVMVSSWHTRYFRNTSLQIIHAKENCIEALCEGTLLNMPDSLKHVNTNQNKLSFGSYFKDFGTLRNLISIQNDGHKWAQRPPNEYPHNQIQQCSARSEAGFETVRQCRQLWHFQNLEEIWERPSLEQRENHVESEQPSKGIVITLPPKLKRYISRGNLLFYRILKVEVNPNNSLIKLILHSNLITIWIGPVRGLNKLVSLDMSCNLAHNISLTFFDTLTSLKELNISKNHLGYQLKADFAGRLFQPLVKLKRLYASKNFIGWLPVNLFQGLVNLQTLVLSYNEIFSFEVDISHINNLTFLDLTYNNIHYLPQNVMDYLDSVAEHNDGVVVDLSFNPIACTCEHLGFLLWMQDTNVVFPNSKEYRCLMSDGLVKRVENIFDVIKEVEKSCTNMVGMLIAAFICLFCLILALVSALIFRYRWKLLYLYYSARLARNNTGNIGDDDFQYHAFVSYASEDSEFVHENLMEELEMRSGLRLNIPDRDFTPGRLMPSNIVDAVQNSRRTLVVLTRALLQSDWCHYEMQMATVEAAHNGRDVLLFVVYEDMASEELPRDVLYNLQASTHITYPAQADPPLVRDFWARLEQAIRS